MAAVLNLPPDHPALARRQLQHWFRAAWEEVLQTSDRFAMGDFRDWATLNEPAPPEAPQPLASVQRGSGMNLPTCWSAS